MEIHRFPEVYTH